MIIKLSYIHFFIALSLVVAGYLGLIANYASAKTSAPPIEYKLLEPLPLGNGMSVTPTANALTFIPGIFRLMIALAGALAVVRLIWAGIKYMSTDAFSGKSEAKGIIEEALWGLLLAISAYVILYTINPNLVNINLDFPKIVISNTSGGGGAGGGETGGGGGIKPGYTLSADQVAQNEQIRKDLDAHIPKIGVNNGPCTTGGTKGCTNLVGLPQGAISGVKNFASSCQTTLGKNCVVEITGGAEGGHVTHGPNLAQVDLGKNMNVNKYITEKGAPSTADCGMKSAPKYSLGGAIYVNEGNHWHVCY